MKSKRALFFLLLFVAAVAMGNVHPLIDLWYQVDGDAIAPVGGKNVSMPRNVSMGSTRVETVTPLGAALSGTVSIDVSASDWYYGTIAGNTEITFTGWSDSGKGDWCMIELVNPGAHALTMDTVQWPGGDTPDWTAAGADVFTVRSRTGGLTIDGQVVGYDYD